MVVAPVHFRRRNRNSLTFRRFFGNNKWAFMRKKQAVFLKKHKNQSGLDIDAFLRNAPRIAGVIVGSLSLAPVKRAVRLGADVIEVRVDTFAKRDPARLASGLAKIRSDKSTSRTPVILTVRSLDEGGKFSLTESERLALFTALIPFADIVDIELSSGRLLKDVLNLTKKHGAKLIVSYHDFDSTPRASALRQIIKKGRAAGADYVKIAAFARNSAQMRRLVGLLAADDDLIIIAMGGYGRPSRIFFPIIGSLLTYGSTTEQTAPGQMTLAEIRIAWRLCGIGI